MLIVGATAVTNVCLLTSSPSSSDRPSPFDSEAPLLYNKDKGDNDVKQITSSLMRDHFPELADEVKYNKKRIIVTRRGKQLVAIVPIEDLELLRAVEDSQDLRDARRALRKAEKEGTIPWEEVKRRHKA